MNTRWYTKQTGPHPSESAFSELNETELGKFSPPLVLVQRRALDPFLHILEETWIHSMTSLIPKYEIQLFPFIHLFLILILFLIFNTKFYGLTSNVFKKFFSSSLDRYNNFETLNNWVERGRKQSISCHVVTSWKWMS